MLQRFLRLLRLKSVRSVQGLYLLIYWFTFYNVVAVFCRKQNSSMQLIQKIRRSVQLSQQ